MNVVDTLLACFAPYSCLVCGRLGTMLCDDCIATTLPWYDLLCYRCSVPTKSKNICSICISSSSLKNVWISTPYKDTAKELISAMKFSRSLSVANIVAKRLDSTTPKLSKNTVITWIPTANTRVRIRGYDQARLIAHELARRRHLQCLETMQRIGSYRQVGSTRIDRFKHVQSSLTIYKPDRFKNRPILLIDDVLTTGATIDSAARLLTAYTSKQIDAAVFAH